MRNKMAINTYLSTVESKKQNEQAEQKQNYRHEECFHGCQIQWGVRRLGGNGEGIKKYELVVTEQSWGSKIQHREQSRQRTYMQDPWTWTMLWVLPEGAGEAGQKGKGSTL